MQYKTFLISSLSTSKSVALMQPKHANYNRFRLFNIPQHIISTLCNRQTTPNCIALLQLHLSHHLF